MTVSLGFLLAVAPTDPRYAKALALLHQSVGSDATVCLYCLAEGVQATADPRLQALRNRGLRLFACSHGALQHGVPIDDRATFGGLGLLTDLLLGVHRFQAVAPGSPDMLEGPSARPQDAPVAAASPRTVVISAPFLAEHPERTTEAARVAAGLAVGRRLKVTLALPHNPPCSAGARLALADDRDLAEHLACFQESDGQMVTVVDTATVAGFTPPPQPSGPGRAITRDTYRQLLSRSFAAIPF